MSVPNPRKDIAVNIIAISVFALTLSSLIGPLINVSVLWPTGLLVGLLVITSLDSFFNQSRLAMVVTDGIARRDPAYVERIVYHEAGHFLLAQLLGIGVTGYVLSPWEAWRAGFNGQAGVAFPPPPTEISGQQLDAYCQVWMAGVAAEQLIYGNSQGGVDDRQKLRGMLSLAGCPASSLGRTENAALLKAKEQLLKHRTILDALALALREGQPLDQCCQLIVHE